MQTLRIRSLFLVGAMAAALAACGKQESDSTAGQKVDNAITEVKQAGQEIKAEAQQAGKQAQNSVENAADSAKQAITDAAITSKINLALAADDRLKASKINVDTTDGRVTLTGQAPDSDSRERATVLAQAVEGVLAVKNQLEVAKNG
ncbi:MAG: BON domain-containing protein [Piscinibacter sp.]|uniref:BON domain-containing protein n=1 Tax=Piscinibacter sp. TaxID=1903157 RepID=UPI003D10AFA7